MVAKETKYLIFVLLLAIVVLVPGCLAQQKDETIKIGAVLVLTGQGTPDQGQASQKAIMMAVDEINSQGGINGKKLEAIFEDSQCQAISEVNAKDVFEKFPFLKERQNEPAFALSGGQRQMLALGRALMQNPELLLLDEPSLGLSPKMMDKVFKKIKQINDEGVSIIMVEQNAKQAIEMADVTYLIEDGKVVLHGGREIIKNPALKDIYFGGRCIVPK